MAYRSRGGSSGSGGRGSGRGDHSRASFRKGIAKANLVGWKRKVEICKHWVKGECDRGDECTFAHGDAELRAPISKTDYWYGEWRHPAAVYNRL
jgi:hypothetical protein